jgi:hypothetical protein
VSLGSVIWWLLVQVSLSCWPSSCPGQLPPKFVCLVFSVIQQFLVQRYWLLECPLGGAAWNIHSERFLLPICNSTSLSGKESPARLWHQCTDEVLHGPQLATQTFFSLMNYWLRWDLNRVSQLRSRRSIHYYMSSCSTGSLWLTLEKKVVVLFYIMCNNNNYVAQFV